jgi:hypothetical protein
MSTIILVDGKSLWNFLKLKFTRENRFSYLWEARNNCHSSNESARGTPAPEKEVADIGPRTRNSPSTQLLVSRPIASQIYIAFRYASQEASKSRALKILQDLLIVSG